MSGDTLTTIDDTSLLPQHTYVTRGHMTITSHLTLFHVSEIIKISFHMGCIMEGRRKKGVNITLTLLKLGYTFFRFLLLFILF